VFYALYSGMEMAVLSFRAVGNLLSLGIPILGVRRQNHLHILIFRR
jgi:hypothetical protein